MCRTPFPRRSFPPGPKLPPCRRTCKIKKTHMEVQFMWWNTFVRWLSAARPRSPLSAGNFYFYWHNPIFLAVSLPFVIGIALASARSLEQGAST
jgi:hypothetical protein